MIDAVSSLRQEAPALGLALGFSSPSHRQVIADAVLLWLETRRAMLAGEYLIAAARMTWWRDALAEKRPEGVPLAERLIDHGGGDLLIAGIDARINATLHGTDPSLWHENLAAWLGGRLGIEGETIKPVFDALEMAYSGQTCTQSVATGQASLDLMGWCCRKPTRLHYPENHPLLALQMMIAVFRLPRKPASG